MGKFERIRNIRQRRKQEQQIRPGKVQNFLTAVLSVVTAGCFPKQRRFKVPFSFENPVHGSEEIEDIVCLTNANTTNHTQDKENESKSSQRGNFSAHVTNLQREQKEPGTQRTKRIIQNLSTKPEPTSASSETPGDDCIGHALEESESAKDFHESSLVKQEMKPGKFDRFLSALRSALCCFVPSAKPFNLPFSFENPVHESKTIEDLLTLSEWTTLNDGNCKPDLLSQSDSYVELNNGDLDNTDPVSDTPSEDSGKQRGNFNENDTDNSTETPNEHGQTSSAGSEPVRRASSGKNTSKLKRSLSWSQGINSFWDGCTRFNREGLFSCGLLRTTNLELRKQRLAERQKEREERMRKEKEEKFGPAKYGYNEDTPLDVYIYNESLWPEGDDVTEDEYVKTWGFDDTGSDSYDYRRKWYDTDQQEESVGEPWEDYDSKSDEEEEYTDGGDNAIPKRPPKKPLLMIKRSPSWPVQLNKPGVKADDGMTSCGILISTEREKRQRKELSLKIRNDTLEYIVWCFYYEGQ